MMATWLIAPASPVAAVSIPLGTADGAVGVYYNDNGGGENPANQSHVRAQFSKTNTNGAKFNFSTTPLPGTGGLLSWFDIFQSVPDQFGLDAIVKAPTYDGTVVIPTLTAYDNGNNSIPGRIAAGPVTWAISGYTGSTDGPGNPANAIINSVLRGGTGANFGNDGVTLGFSNLVAIPGGFSIDIAGELLTDGLIHWYTVSTPDSPVSNFELTGKLFFSGTLTYLVATDTTPLIDFYEGPVAVSAEVICGTRYVDAVTGADALPGPTPNTCRNPAQPCKTIQRTIELSCPGDTILVDPGLYAEAPVIDRAITLLATSPATEASAGNAAVQAIIDGSGAQAAVRVATGVSDVTIDGFEITNPTCAVSGDACYGIFVNSFSSGAPTVAVDIRNNVVHAIADPARTFTGTPEQGEFGILAQNVGSASITGNTIYDVFDSVPPNGSGRGQGIVVKNTNGSASGVTIADNVVHDVQDVGIRADGGGGALAEDVDVTGNMVFSVGVGGLGFRSGIGIDHLSDGGVVSGNFVRDIAGGFGLGITTAGASTVSNNFVRDVTGGNPTFAGAGIAVAADGVAVLGNSLVSNGIGVIVSDGAGGTLSGVVANQNCIRDNGVGLANQSQTTVDATNNWWGAADGPSGTGPGSGDAIVDTAGTTTFAPFSSAPNCSAFAARTLNLFRCDLRADTVPSVDRNNGSIKLKGQVDDNAPFDGFIPDVQAGFTVRVSGAGGVVEDIVFTPADCVTKLTSKGPAVFCKVKTLTVNNAAKIKPRRASLGPNIFDVQVKAKKRSFAPPLTGDPVNVTILATSLDRTDDIGETGTCIPKGSPAFLVKCRETGALP